MYSARILTPALSASTTDMRRSVLMRYLALVLMTTFLGPSLARAGDLSGLGNQLLDMQVRAMTPWRQNDGDMQVVVANAPNDKGRDTVPRLLFFGRAPNGMALQYSEEGEIAPVAVFQTNSVGGPLLVIWGSGTGLIVRAYALVNGKIQRVLDDGSFRMPEVIHPN